MKDSLQVGVHGSLSTFVGADQTIRLGDMSEATVFSTPSMINLMEYAARDALAPHLADGEESVGVDVNVTHTSATPPRSKVVAQATVTAIEKNVISFNIVAKDAWGEIGRGTHRRAIISTEKFAERLKAQKSSPIHGQFSTLSDLISTFVHLRCEAYGSILHITLDRPNKRNAINAQMTCELEQLADCLERRSNDIRVVIVSGSGDTFCAGDDVGDLPDDAEAARDLSLRRGSLYQQLTELPQIFIAAIDGLAIGGGFVFASACDLRVSTFRAKFALPEVSLGWPPNYGMGIVQARIGNSHSMALALTGDMIDAQHAKSVGLVHRVVAPTQLSSSAMELAKQLTAQPRDALTAAKQLLAPGQTWSDVTASNRFVKCLTTEDAITSRRRFGSGSQ